MKTKLDEKISNAILTGCDLKASKFQVNHFKFPWLSETEIESRIDIYYQDKRIVEITNEHIRINHQGFITKAFATRLRYMFKTVCNNLHDIQYQNGRIYVRTPSDVEGIQTNFYLLEQGPKWVTIRRPSHKKSNVND
tara:strand:+ start:1148 stop:1558 length:411 start_codon:yes stop_codon:yes gene_type:complete